MKQRAFLRLPAFVLLFGILGGLAFAWPAAAQSSDDAMRSNITLSPASQRMTIDAGATVSGKVSVVNDGTTDEDVIVYSRPYSVKGEAYEPDYDNKAPNTDIYQWIRFATTSYHIKAGQTLEIPYVIQVPTGAAPGGHYGVIFVETQPPKGSSDAVIRKKRVGTIVLATIEGEVKRAGSVLSTGADWWQTRPPLTVNSRVKSTGNTDIQVTTQLKVSDLFGAVKYEAAKEFTVYPGTTRRIDQTWDTAPWFGLFRAEQTITVLGKSTTGTQYVLVAPRWLPITVFVLVIVGVVYGWRKRRTTS